MMLLVGSRVFSNLFTPLQVSDFTAITIIPLRWIGEKWVL
jgi:hypothetical protein